MLDILNYLKETVLIAAGGTILAKIGIEWLLSRREKKDSVNVNVNNTASNSNGNGKTQYATMRDLMDHAIECPRHIHEKIEEYNRRLGEKMDENHKETMSTFSQIKVSLRELQLRKD